MLYVEVKISKYKIKRNCLFICIKFSTIFVVSPEDVLPRRRTRKPAVSTGPARANPVLPDKPLAGAMQVRLRCPRASDRDRRTPREEDDGRQREQGDPDRQFGGRPRGALALQRRSRGQPPARDQRNVVRPPRAAASAPNGTASSSST